IVPRLLLSAHTLSVDGQRIGAAGIVGPTAESTTPQDLAYLATFVPTDNHLEIIVQLSNFHHHNGGIENSLEFGPQTQIYNLSQETLGFDLFLLGAILIMGLYHLSLFSLRRGDKS